MDATRWRCSFISKPIRASSRNGMSAHAVELAAAKVSIPNLRAATSRLADGLASQASRVFTRWLHDIAQPVT
jgi:hypothetical protein